MKVRLTRRARADLLDIWIYVAEQAGSPAAADRLYDGLDAACRSLAEFPEKGPRVPELGPDARHLVVGSYRVFYRLHEGAIQVVRVLHGRRNIFGDDLSGK